MEDREIREFRRDLRLFGQILDDQVRYCCTGGTRAQCQILLALAESGPLPNVQLAALLQVDASTLSRTADPLVRKKLVARKPHPTDRRASLLTLTIRGRETADGINRAADDLYRGILGNLPPEQREEILPAFARLVEVFRRWYADEGGRNACCAAPKTRPAGAGGGAPA